MGGGAQIGEPAFFAAPMHKTSITVETSSAMSGVVFFDDRHFIGAEVRLARAAFLVSRSPRRAPAVPAISSRDAQRRKTAPRGDLCPWRDVSIRAVDRAPLRRPLMARRAVRRRLRRLGARLLRLRGIRPLPEMDRPAADNSPLCVAEDAGKQLEAAVRFILGRQDIEKISLISHSWGSMPAGLFAGAHPALVDRLVLLAPIAQRAHEKMPASFPAWRIVTLQDQWNRFVEDVPAHEPAVLSRVHFEEWGERYLDSDFESRTRDPAAVKTPLGPFSEIIRAWHGQLAYDPAQVRAPDAIIRGEWDSLMRDDDARWLFDAFTGSPIKRDIKIGRGTHLMHLETMRLALWQESIGFLRGDDAASVIGEVR
jgi:pimeloyl-ACP methyl ester carboxylesterase